MNSKHNRIFFPILFLFAGIALLLCSQCSPLYPLNVWDDANCLLTVGRVLRSGGVLYRDIYEQKGPLLYLIQAIGACISDSSFLGVWILEILSLGTALCCAFGIFRKKVGELSSLFGCCLLCVLTVSCRAFSKGDSAEEFCLPFLMGAAALASSYDDTLSPMNGKKLFFCGILAGCVGMIKYTVLGLFVGLCCVEGFLAIREGGFLRAVRSGIIFLAGMFLPVLPWLAYFAANRALENFFTAYFYNNIFLYEGTSSGILASITDILSMMLHNWIWAIPAAIGCLAVLLREKGAARMSVLLMACMSALCVFCLGRTWSYSPLILTPFALFGIRFLLELAEFHLRLPARKVLRAALCLAFCAGLLALSGQMTPNRYLRGKSRRSLAQYRLAQYIPEGVTLLQYSHLDDGFYLTTGILPEERYFVRLNVHLDEMNQSLDQALEEKRAEYVVTSWSPLPDQYLSTYQLIAKDAGYDESDRLNKGFWLYRRYSDESISKKFQK